MKRPSRRVRYQKKKAYKKRQNPIQKRLPKVQLYPELKFTGANYSNLGVDYNGTGIYLLNGIDQGTSVTTRVGNNIKMKSVNLRLTLSTDVTTTYYIALVYDKQTKGTIMAISDWIQAIGGNYLPYSQRENANKERFVTLRNWVMDMSPNRAGATIQKTFNKFVKFARGVPTIFTGSGSTVSSINMGGLYLVIGSSSSTGPTFSGTHRVKYTDE